MYFKCTWISSIILCTLLAHATPQGWKQYEGAWFSVQYPENFHVMPYEKSTSFPHRYNSVQFYSPDKTVAFQLFSPQWNGTTALRNINVKKEKVTHTSKKSSQKDTILHQWLTIEALDQSYIRYLYHYENTISNTTKIFGLRCTTAQKCREYHKSYQFFKKSLVQYAD